MINHVMINHVQSFEYDDYGIYIKYIFTERKHISNGERKYIGYESVENFDFKSAIQKPVINNYGKFMKRLFNDIKTTSNGMVFLDIEDMQDVENIFEGISLDDIKQFFKEYELLGDYLEGTLEIFFTESDFQEIKKGNFESVIDGCIGEVYGDFLCMFNEEI